ncbi:butyrophilin subfamily 2 member A2 [Lates calcarifer]|uniref:Butyrophilin subfamily 2 member A2 n=1 Tax=Lates calcarifer TaxID=8187 RepID=A0AAJ8B2I1_LATCA|nr:butyrophilin subfamily 2 member A2 [Lates calcarifer]
MTDLKDGLSSKSLLRTTGAVVLVLLLTHVCGGQLQRTPPKVVVMLGDDTVLPCQLEPPTNAVQMTIEWGRNDLNPRFVYVWHDGRELLTDQNEAYTGRASLDINKLKQGDISLRLSTVKVSDNGTYRCYLPKQSQEYFIDLVVGAVSSPTISLAGLDKSISAVVLECESKGWYPEPEVLWLDGEGNLLSAGPTETVRGPDDLYTVSSRVTVEKRHSNSFTCRVQQNKTNQTRETHIHIPDDFFMSPYSSTHAITIGLVVGIVLILLVVFFLWKWRKTIINEGEKNNSEGNKTEVQVVTEGERERETLMTETEQVEDLNERKEEKKHLRKSELQKKEEEAEIEVERLKKELETKTTEFIEKQVWLQKLREENQRMKILEESQSERSRDAPSHSSFPPWRIISTQKLQEQQRRTQSLEQELQTKKEEVEGKQKEIQQLQDQKQRQQTELQRLNQELEEKNKQLERNQTAAEREEERLKSQTKQSAGRVSEPQSSQVKSSSSVSQSSTIIVDEIDPEGKYIRLRNLSSEDQPLGGWSIYVEVDNRKPIIYTFDYLRLRAKETVTIWASDSGVKDSYPTDLVWSGQKSLGHGNQTVVTVFSSSGQEVTMRTFTAKHGS